MADCWFINFNVFQWFSQTKNDETTICATFANNLEYRVLMVTASIENKQFSMGIKHEASLHLHQKRRFLYCWRQDSWLQILNSLRLIKTLYECRISTSHLRVPSLLSKTDVASSNNGELYSAISYNLWFFHTIVYRHRLIFAPLLSNGLTSFICSLVHLNVYPHSHSFLHTNGVSYSVVLSTLLEHELRYFSIYG